MLFKIILLFIFGAVVGTVCDLFHVASYITGYTQPFFLAQAWWVPLSFGVGAVVIALSHVFFDQRFKRPKRDLTWSRVVHGIVAFIFMYYISGYWPVLSQTKFVLLAFSAITIWFIFDKSVYGLIYAVLTALIGCSFEISLIHAKLFYYTQAEFHGIVFWLPCLYVAASVAVGNLGRKLFQDYSACGNES